MTRTGLASMLKLCLILLSLGVGLGINASRPIDGPQETPNSVEEVALRSQFIELSFLKLAEPIRYLEETEEQRTAWERVAQQCSLVDISDTVDDSCFLELTTYYTNQPIWDYSRMRYYDSFRGVVHLNVRPINSRPRMLSYGYADYAIDQVPLWSDIFDGRLAERKEKLLQVMEDETCMKLGTPESAGIQEDLALECSAREIYKYATYLDACAIAFQRLEVLHAPDETSSTPGVFSKFNMSKYLIESFVHDYELQNLAVKRLQQGYMHSHWVTKQCSSNDLVLLPNPWLPKESQHIQWSNDKDFLNAVDLTHDTLLKIAAKSGDEWAIMSYPLSSRTSSEFNADVRARYPLLMHRHLASTKHAGLSGELQTIERNRHRAKAYLLLEELAGKEVAQEEIDISGLHEEINYVRSGGELKYPFAE